MKKILFLDHDGVICTYDEWGSRMEKQRKARRKLSQSIRALPVQARFDDFNQDSVKILNQIITETDCEIIVSSDWRLHATVEELGEYYTSQGIIRKPIDFTPTNLPVNLKYNYRQSYNEQTRSYEILQWLSEHPEVTDWVAVDDLDMRKFGTDSDGTDWERGWGLPNFVWTFNSITEKGKYEEIVKYLKGVLLPSNIKEL